MAATMPFGFRIVGPVTEVRLRVNARAALTGYADCDPRAEVEREAYLSAFTFGPDFSTYLESTGSPKGFAGPCFAPWLWWDIDRRDALDAALADARRLAANLLERFRDLDENDLLLFFSGWKGFHVGLPTVWQPEPSTLFNAVAKHFAETAAGRAAVQIDLAIYDKVRPFRAPNSKHPQTGLFKRRLRFDELMELSLDGIRKLAIEPEPFDVPTPTHGCEQAAADWREAVQAVEQRMAQRTARRSADASTGRPGRLQRETLDFIRNGANEGERHKRLFRAAANLAEFNCPSALAHELLTEGGLDSGLTPSDVKRQIDCGLAYAGRQQSEPSKNEEQPK